MLMVKLTKFNDPLNEQYFISSLDFLNQNVTSILNKKKMIIFILIKKYITIFHYKLHIELG